MNNLYRRKESRHLWCRVRTRGRDVRFSTGTSNLEKAAAVRDTWIAADRAARGESAWHDWVGAQMKDGGGWARLTLARMRRKAKRRGRRPLTLIDLGIILARCKGRCEVSGEALRVPDGTRHALNASIDRRDSSKGYSVENCRVVTLALNLAMSDWGEDFIRQLARKLVEQEKGHS